MEKESGKGTRHSIIQKLLLAGVLCLPFSVIVTQCSLPYAHAQQAQGESITVQITGAAQPPGFLPALLTVHLYDTIVFINQSAPAATYAIAAQDGSFASPGIAHGEQWAVTVNTTGPHPYSVSAVSTMVGEIFVVANTVSLLPTPLPQAQATVDAAVTTGKSPPDVAGLSTTTVAQNGIGQSPFTPLLILIVILNSLLTVSLLITLTIWLLMRRRAAKKALMVSLEGMDKAQQHDGELADSSQQETTKSKRRFFWQRRKENDEDDDDAVELDMDDDEE